MFPYAEKTFPVPPAIAVENIDEDWNFNVEESLVESSDRGSSQPVVQVEQPCDHTGADHEAPQTETVDSIAVEEEVTTGAADLTDDFVSNPPATNDLGRGKRQHVPSVKLKDYVTYNATVQRSVLSPHLALATSNSESSASIQGNSLYPLTTFVSDSKFTPLQQAFLAAITAGVEPKHFKEAVGIDVWDDSMTDEIIALEGQHM